MEKEKEKESLNPITMEKIEEEVEKIEEKNKVGKKKKRVRSSCSYEEMRQWKQAYIAKKYEEVLKHFRSIEEFEEFVNVYSENYKRIKKRSDLRKDRRIHCIKFAKAMKRLGFEDNANLEDGRRLRKLSLEHVLEEMGKLEDFTHKYSSSFDSRDPFDTDQCWVERYLYDFKRGEIPSYIMTKSLVVKFHQVLESLGGDAKVVTAENVWELLPHDIKEDWPLLAVRYYLAELQKIRDQTGDPNAIVTNSWRIPSLNFKLINVSKLMRKLNRRRGLRCNKEGKWILKSKRIDSGSCSRPSAH